MRKMTIQVDAIRIGAITVAICMTGGMFQIMKGKIPPFGLSAETATLDTSSGRNTAEK